MAAIVTGGTSGLGLHITQLLRERGERVITVSRRPGADVQGDASKRETAQRAVDAAGDVNLLLNCAGIGIYGAAGTYDDEAITRMISSNLLATIVFCELLAPKFKRDGGTIVNVLSTAGLVGKPNETVYCAAKWGARGYTEALRAEAKGTKLRVIAAAPGGMNTPFWTETRGDFLDPKDVAAVIVDAIDRGVHISELVIQRFQTS